MSKRLTKHSRFLSLVLRHKPEVVGLRLDENGWVDVDELIVAANKNGKNFDRELLMEIVVTNDKQRFSFSEDGSRIRANQGHSLKDVDVGLKSIAPPAALYHGTVDRFLNAIRAEGLLNMNRQHVHLSADIETAENVGRRRGTAVILEIDAGRMHEESFEFFLSENGVWLTDHVPSEFIRFP